jgi:hypothetical protein
VGGFGVRSVFGGGEGEAEEGDEAAGLEEGLWPGDKRLMRRSKPSYAVPDTDSWHVRIYNKI